MKLENAYLIFKSDFKNRSWIDWIKSHIMGAPPPFRFEGSILFDYNGIKFSGYDSHLKENAEFNILKDEITQIYYGYDETYNTFQTRGMGLNWAPIRFTFNSTQFEDETDVYLVSGFNGVFSENQTLFEELKIWLS